MKLYRLTPTRGDFDGWKYSAYRGAVIVRAENEAQARRVATHGFAKAALVDDADATSANPWTEKAVVAVSEVRDERFSVAGRPEVLEPLGY